jgi:hypothetical protein
LNSDLLSCGGELFFNNQPVRLDHQIHVAWFYGLFVQQC